MPRIPLILFLRAPVLGTVKSRLAAGIGPEAALAAYTTLLDTLVHSLRSESEVELRVTPDDGAARVAPWLQPGWQVQPQGDGDLGDRLHRATSAHLTHGSAGVLVIGSDCPDVTPADLQEAREQLVTHDVVLGPALDGGYWLIGLRRPAPTLFAAMPWGTGSVLGETLRRLGEAGLTHHLLRPLADIDTASDWESWLGRRPRSAQH